MAIPDFYVVHHYFLDSVCGPYHCFKVGHTKDLRGRLTNRAYITCFEGLFRYVFTIETENAEYSKKLIGSFSIKTKTDSAYMYAPPAITLNWLKCPAKKLTIL